MKSFEFVSAEKYPEDPYVAESAIICVDGKHRVTYVRKKSHNGGAYWDVIATAVQKDGGKKYLKSFVTDSNFLREDIMDFLDARSWEKGQVLDEPPF